MVCSSPDAAKLNQFQTNDKTRLYFGANSSLLAEVNVGRTAKPTEATMNCESSRGAAEEVKEIKHFHFKKSS